MVGMTQEDILKLEKEIIGVLRQGVDVEYIEAYLNLMKIHDRQEAHEMFDKYGNVKVTTYSTSTRGVIPITSTGTKVLD